MNTRKFGSLLSCLAGVSIILWYAGIGSVFLKTDIYNLAILTFSMIVVVLGILMGASSSRIS